MKFQLFRDKVDEYRVRLRAANGEVLMTSEGYVEKRDAEHLIKLVRETSADTVVEDLTL